MKKRVVILTGNEARHRYFRVRMANDTRFEVVSTICEGTEKSLAVRTDANESSSRLERLHVAARAQAEEDFFREVSENLVDHSHPRHIVKGAINDPTEVDRIIALNPDLLVCYGASLVKSSLLEHFAGRFLNVHLGLSPWYRGSGTNIWPLINGEPSMVGVTFMHIDAGIDTGRIIHQIRADIFLGDSPHSIGNRLIRKMTTTYADLVAHFDELSDPPQPDEDQGRLYLQKDYDAAACERLYAQFRDGMIERYLHGERPGSENAIVVNPALAKSV